MLYAYRSASAQIVLVTNYLKGHNVAEIAIATDSAMPTGPAGLQGLSSVQLISTGQWCCSRRPYARSRIRQAFICQICAASKSTSAGVAMRELPLPGTSVSDTANNKRDFKHTKPAPRADNGLGSNRNDASANDAARRGSGKEASTSSSGSVTFQPPQQSSLARTNGAAVRQTQRRSDNNTYDATIAVNQAAPGFTAASRSAVAATEQRAENLIDAGQSKLLRVRHYLHVTPCAHALEDSASQPKCTA